MYSESMKKPIQVGAAAARWSSATRTAYAPAKRDSISISMNLI